MRKLITNDLTKDLKVLVGKRKTKAFPIEIIPAKNTEFGVKLKIQNNKHGYRWTENDWLVLDLESDILSALKITVYFNTKNNQRFRVNTFVIGNRRLKCVLPIWVLDGNNVFLPVQPGQMKTNTFGKAVSVDDIDNVVITIPHGRAFKKLVIHDIYLTDTLPEIEIEGGKIVDRLGQYTDFEWDGKCKSEEELIETLKKELEWAKENDFYPNPDFDEYGGYKKLNFGATGKFYQHHDGHRHWLVDPLGNAFFSNGICYGNRAGIFGHTYKMESLYEWLPDHDDETFKEAWCKGDNIPGYVDREGLDKVKDKWLFSFTRANYIRAFGKDNWHDAFCKITSARLKQWSFNSIGVGVNDYTDERTSEFLEKCRIPYCITLKNFPKTKVCLFRDFPDVFSEEYESLAKEYAKQVIPYKDDPYFIGYFATNEPEWMFQHDLNIAGKVFATDCNSYSKQKMIDILKDKYRAIRLLNNNWKSNFESWEDLNKPFNYLDFEGAKQDINRLMNTLVERYSSVICDSLKEVAPDTLNLGMRFNSIKSCKYAGVDKFDVFSYNCYSSTFDKVLKIVYETTDRPMILGEWHIGSSEKGLLSNALVNATTQRERSKALAEYLRLVLVGKIFVGMHYFEYNDQPVLGRFDGENMQIGLVDVCSKPYTEGLEELTQVSYNMYEILTGEKKIKKFKWKFNPRF